jgi:hypothetical protein
MKKLIVLVVSAALLASVSVSSFASTKSVEKRCKAQAEKHKISEDKLDAYVKTCVDKHMKHMKRVKHVKHEKKAEAPAAAPIVAPTAAPAAPAPAEPAK